MIDLKQCMTRILFISAFTLLTAMNAHAEDGAIRFSNNAFKQVITKTPDGSTEYDYVEPGLVLPDDVILYEIVFENISNQDVSNIVVNNPIANNSVYLDAASRTMIDYGDPNYLRDHSEQAVVRQFLTRGSGAGETSEQTQGSANE